MRSQLKHLVMSQPMPAWIRLSVVLNLDQGQNSRHHQRDILLPLLCSHTNCAFINILIH